MICCFQSHLRELYVFTIYSLYFQCRLLSVPSPVTEWLSVFLHNPSFVAPQVSARPSVREVLSSIPSDTTSFSFNFSLLHTCQLSRIIWEFPELIRHRSLALLYGSPYLPDKVIFRAFVCLTV